MSAAEDLAEGPVVKRLRDIDDKYLELQREFERERSNLAKRYTEKQQVFLRRRKELLIVASTDGVKIGTPGLAGFWCKALQNHEAFQEKVREWDEPVLEHLVDIEVEKFDPETEGFRVIFRFSENPYFSNTELSVEYYLSESNPYLETVDVEKIVSNKIDWKPGQDITVQKVSKKAKGGGAKKGKQKKEQCRPSFFSEFIVSLQKGMSAENIPGHLQESVQEALDAGAPSEMIFMQLMESHYECGVALRDNIVPFAVRWYTGEACVDEDDDDDDDNEEEEDEEEESGDDDELESDEEDEEPKPKASAGEERGKKKEEDCKQQ